MTLSHDQGSSPKSAPDSAGASLQMMISADLLLKQMYESVTDFAIYTIDLDGHVTSWNAGALKIFGYANDEALGMNSAVMFTDEDVRSGQPMGEMHTATQDGRAADFRWHLRKDGSRFWADGVLTPVRSEAGGTIGFLKILRDITERKLAEDEIGRLARTDALTGLYNRAAFDIRRKELTAAALRNGHKLLLFMIDLDRFKEINDTCGHHAGDQLLTEAAARLSAISRESDVVARIGGDEFAMLQVNPASPLLGATSATKVLEALSSPFRIDGREVHISGSVGIAVYPDDASDPDGLLKCADLALYAAKAQGRNCYHYFTDALDTIAHQRNLDQAELRRLEHHKAFQLVYQPIVDAESGQTLAMEALLRFPGPVLEKVSVDYVVELAKEIGLIADVGKWVFAQACAQLVQWRAAGIAPLKIAINTCSQELLNPEYLPTLTRLLDQFGLLPPDFDLELTERDAIHLGQASTSILQSLSAAGYGLVLDDFGTGYSSLSYLRELPVGGLKLDRSFLMGVPEQDDANAIARAVISLARDLRLVVIAEGVEHELQARFLRNAGCNAFQGFLFGMPMSVDEASLWLAGGARLA